MSQLLFLLILTNYTTPFVLISSFTSASVNSFLFFSFILFMGVVTLIGHFVKNIFTSSWRPLPQKPLKAEGHSFYSLSLIFCLFLCFYALGHSPIHTRITPTFFVHVFSLYHSQFSPSTFASIPSSSPSFFSLLLISLSLSLSLSKKTNKRTSLSESMIFSGSLSPTARSLATEEEREVTIRRGNDDSGELLPATTPHRPPPALAAAEAAATTAPARWCSRGGITAPCGRAVGARLVAEASIRFLGKAKKKGKERREEKEGDSG